MIQAQLHRQPATCAAKIGYILPYNKLDSFLAISLVRYFLLLMRSLSAFLSRRCRCCRCYCRGCCCGCCCAGAGGVQRLVRRSQRPHPGRDLGGRSASRPASHGRHSSLRRHQTGAKRGANTSTHVYTNAQTHTHTRLALAFFAALLVALLAPCSPPTHVEYHFL